MPEKMIAFLLLRESLLGLLENIHLTLLPDASLREEGGENPIARFADILKEALRYRIHGRDWYLHGTSSGGEAPKVLRVADNYDLRYLDLLSYVHSLAKSYSWCLIPWGVYGTGEMIAFISSDPEIFAKAMKYLTRGNQDLFVSSYTIDELMGKRFRGAVFLCSAEDRSRLLWEKGGGSPNSMLILNYCTADRPSALPRDADIVCEAPGYQIGNAVRRRWIRVRSVAALQYYLANRYTTIVIPPGLDEHVLWLSLQDFAGVAEHVNRDPLYFGVKALESVSWIYIPTNYDEKWEIYINQNADVTRTLLESEDLTRAPYFLHKYFC